MIVAQNGKIVVLPDENTDVDIDYSSEVAGFIRQKYSVDDEIAILRQKDIKPAEFAEYNAYCEECKAKVKAFISDAGGVTV